MKTNYVEHDQVLLYDFLLDVGDLLESLGNSQGVLREIRDWCVDNDCFTANQKKTVEEIRRKHQLEP